MKKEIKKSLSLFLAVLMLLTSWVWVAPEKAEAADVNTQYYVIFKTNVKDTGNENSSSVTINFKYSNGTGSASSVSKSYGQQGWSGDNVVIYEGYINGFPTSVSYTFKIDSTRSERHENYQLLVGKDKASCTTNVIPLDSYTYKGDYTYSKTVNADAYPVLTEGGGSLSAESVDLGKVGTSTNATSKLTLSGFKDQYGVAWGDISYGFSLNAGDGVTLGSHASISKSSNTATVTVKPSFQTLFPGKSSAKINIPWTAATKKGTAVLTVNFPTYTITFDANGGKIGASDSDAKDKIEVTSEKMNIGSTIGKSPAYRTKDGFDFVGFYTDKNADATGLSASFTGTPFKDDESTVPTQGDVTYYAAWKAKAVTATFMTADNQLIGTVEGRYNNYLTAENMYNGDAGLNAAVKAAYGDATKIKFDSSNAPIYKDGDTTYTFAGWRIIKAYDESLVDKNEDTVLKGDVTFQAVYTKADAKKYTVKFEDGAGNVISTKEGYNYRDAVTNVPATEPTKAMDDKYEYAFIGWAKKLANVNYFAIDESGQDADGVKIAYTPKDAAEFIVKGDDTYIPVFRMTAREYSVTFNYKVDGGDPASVVIGGYHWDDAPRMPEIKDNYTNVGARHYLTGWFVGDDTTEKKLDEIKVNGDTVLTANYGRVEQAKYAINFYGKGEDGIADVLLDNGEYTHGSTVTAPEVPQTIATEDALYTFAGWSPAINTTASGDVDYYATYTKKTYADVYFYNYDGTLLYSIDGKEEGLFVGDDVPAYTNIDAETGENVLPSKAEDAVGTYNFTGWKDGEGNAVVPGTDKLAGDLHLTAQFETVYKDYTVKFVNDGGEVVSETTYHYGEEITVPADPTKAEDVEFKYKFRAWSPEVSEICYDNAVYTATYTREYKYYKVTWLNDAKAVLSTSNYKYGAKIQAAVVNDPVDYEPAETGKTWAFDYWVQCDADGNDILVDGKQVQFVRGLKMGSEPLYFYPVFKQVANILTVKFYKEDGTTLLGTATYDYGQDISEHADAFKVKAPKAADNNKHYVIDKWVNVEGGGEVSTITADVSVKATYTAYDHNKVLDEMIAEPTANVPGYGYFRCEAEECDLDPEIRAIAPIADEGAPTGQIYVGNVKWTSKNYKDGINYDEITYVGSKTNLIVNAADTGSRSMTNPEAEIFRGVGTISYYVSEGIVSDLSTITSWTEVYNVEAARQKVLEEVLKEYKQQVADINAYNGLLRGDMEDLILKAEIDREVDKVLAGYKANATGIVSNLNLENGREYIIYICVTDRAGNGEVNKAYFSSGTISYGSEAPVITVAGEGVGSEYCASATVTISDDTDGYTVYFDGVEVAASDIATVSTKGSHKVTVVDKHGNQTTKTFEIKGKHEYRNYTIAENCENDGSRYDICTVCGNKANEQVLPKKGHKFTTNYVDKAPTCTVDGTRTYICDNNCGTKLVLNPTDDAETLAQAKVAVDPKAEKIEWRDLTAEDLKHLKSTGNHTYAYVKDANGNDTAELAWVIDEAATCTVKGSKHIDCTVCGTVGRITEEIDLDTENGHKFYREKVTTEPTCTEQGIKTKTCRYCGEVEFVKYVDALGHTASEEYRINIEPTCQAPGNKILVCEICGEDMGDYIEIPALGCAWKKDGDIVKVEKEVDGEIVTIYIQYYKCSRCGETKEEILKDYVEPKEVQITFVNGTETFASFTKFVGESITATDVETPVKAADATMKYTFAYWKDAEGKEVKFPIDVKEDATFKAEFTGKYINYTVTYYTDDATTEYKKTGYLHNGDVVTLAAGPSKAGDNLVTYKFAGWVVKGSNPEVVLTDTVTIDGANVELVAKYTTVKKQYAVTYAYSRDNTLETFNVEAGTIARDCMITPVKAFDAKYHYEFAKWNKAVLNKENNTYEIKVESNVYTTPDFEAVSHTYTHEGGKVLKTAATCTEKAVYVYTCTCGYSYEAAEGEALGHDWADPVTDATTGTTTVSCQREGCDASEEDTRTFTVEFYINADDDKAIKTVSYIEWGTKIDATRLPADPTKDSTATTEFKFLGWALKDDADKTIVDVKNVVVTEDASYVAVFEEITRKYTVTFAYDAKNVIKIYKDVPAGTTVTYTGAVPTKNPDANYHYTFKGWSGSTDDIQGDVYVTAQWNKIEHVEIETELTAASCTTGQGTRYWCDCNGNGSFDAMVDGDYVDFYREVTGKPLDHEYEQVGKKEATEDAPGYIRYQCKNCGHSYDDTVEFVDNYMYIEIYVKNNDGQVVEGARVDLYCDDGKDPCDTDLTNKDGYVVFRVEKGHNYYYVVSFDGESDGNKTPVGEGRTDASITVHKCSCACHGDGIWASIFRFFHKIIKMFTGEFKCCKDPDSRY